MNKPPNTASTLSATEAAERQLPSIGDYLDPVLDHYLRRGPTARTR